MDETRSASDFFRIDDLLTDQERAIRERVRLFCDHEVTPVINQYWEKAEFPFALLPGIASLRVCGGTIRGYDSPGLSAVATGMVSMELARGDGSLNTFMAVQSGLVMQAIARFGSDDQKQRWLPRLARMESIGAFALTEPQHGSDVVLLETRATRESDGYVIDGEKTWIGNGTIADVVVVWARDTEGHVGAYLVERGTFGMRAEVITGKTSQRAVWQANMQFERVRIPAANRLPGARSFRDTTAILTHTRQTVAWDAVGHAMACYEHALAYTGKRLSFGKPLTSYQLVQDKLARMLAEVTTMQLMCLRLSQLLDAGKMTAGMASLAKMHCASRARQVAAEARDLLGGAGILLENHVARHQADLESIYTYEGTDHIQALIVGREITGIQAFSHR